MRIKGVVWLGTRTEEFQGMRDSPGARHLARGAEGRADSGDDDPAECDGRERADEVDLEEAPA